MAKVGFNDTTLLGTSAESRYLLTAYALDNISKLTRNSATELQCEAQTGKRNFIIVNGEIVSLSSAKTCTVSGAGAHNLIAADGTDASATPSASTLYNIYLSNASASFAASSCRLSATAPSADANGVLYLATSGNGHNWRFVGAVQLDGSTQIANAFAICGYGKNEIIKFLSADVVKSSGTTNYYTTQTQDYVVLPGTKINVESHSHLVGSDVISLAEKIETNNKISVAWLSGTVFLCRNFLNFLGTSAEKLTLVQSYYYTSGFTVIVSGDDSYYETWLQITRETE